MNYYRKGKESYLYGGRERERIVYKEELNLWRELLDLGRERERCRTQ